MGCASSRDTGVAPHPTTTPSKAGRNDTDARAASSHHHHVVNWIDDSRLATFDSIPESHGTASPHESDEHHHQRSAPHMTAPVLQEANTPSPPSTPALGGPIDVAATPSSYGSERDVAWIDFPMPPADTRDAEAIGDLHQYNDTHHTPAGNPLVWPWPAEPLGGVSIGSRSHTTRDALSEVDDDVPEAQCNEDDELPGCSTTEALCISNVSMHNRTVFMCALRLRLEGQPPHPELLLELNQRLRYWLDSVA